MGALIKTLIDKKDTFEIIRDEIAAILVLEVANQKALATAAKKDPALWDFNVFIERSNPWELRETSDGKPDGEPPLVNIFFDTDAMGSEANLYDPQIPYTGIFNIDCYGAKNTKEESQGVHSAGDELSARESQRIARIVRNILAGNEYQRLNIPEYVSHIKIRQRNSLQPNIQDRPAQNIMVTRIVLEIKYLEFNYETIPETLELVSNKCEITEDGLIYFTLDFDYT